MTGFNEGQLVELTAPLKREHVKQRTQAGRTFSYIEGWRVIDDANRIFGFDAWDRQTVDLRCVVEKETKIGQHDPRQQRDGWRVGYICKVCVCVRTDTSTVLREGTGFGSGIDVDLGAAHESAAKEAETDATKRALMTFGNPFGLALYDKEQANVEAPAPPPRPAAKLPPAVPRDPADQASTVPQRDHRTHPKYPIAAAANERIRAALENATTPKLVDEIMAVNAADLELISEIRERTAQHLRDFAHLRKTEMLASA